MADQRRAEATGGRRPEPAGSVRVVYPGYHRSWSRWIVHRLRAHGQRVSENRWEPDREQPLEEALGDLLRGATGKVLLVLSDWFFQIGPRPAGDWPRVLRGFVADHADRFAAVNLTNRDLPTAAAVLEPVDLWGVGEEEAERRLLDRLELRGRPRSAQLRLADPDLPRFPNEPVPEWGDGVPRRNRLFTGRDQLLAEIQQHFADTEYGSAVCALVGTSGIGKTQIAAEYAYRFSPDYDLVWWVTANQRGTLRDRFGELGGALGMGQSLAVGERIRRVREALERGEPYRRWLLVFDGWEDLDELDACLPRNGTGHVLVTTRNRSWAEYADLVEVPVFRRSESLGYLLRRAAKLDPAGADRIAAEFGDMPIQVAQSAAYLGETGDSAETYLQMVRERNSPWSDTDGKRAEYEAPAYTSWSMTLTKLRRIDPHAVELLALCCAFAPGRIPLGLVQQVSDDDLPPELRWLTSDGPAWSRALETLANYSVLTRESRSSRGLAHTRDSEAGGETDEREQRAAELVRMHALPHRIIGDLLAGDESRIYRQIVRRLLAGADPGSPEDSRTWPQYTELLPHLTAAGMLTSRSPRSHTLLLNCLRFCYFGGEYSVGAALAEKIREAWTEIFQPNERTMRDLTTLQGNLLRADGRFTEAYALDTERLERLKAWDDAPERALMSAMGCLAADQRFLGQYTEALQKQREVVATAERIYGPEHHISLLGHHNLAVCLRLLGRYAQAYEEDEKTYRAREALLRASHGDTLASANACARGLRLLGRYQEAMARQELAVRRLHQLHGHDHPKTLWARQNLALSAWRAGLAQDTGAVLADLAEKNARANGREHFSTLSVLTDLGNYLRVHGDLAHARDHLEEADAGYRTLLGPAHPLVIAMQSNLGLVLQAEGAHDLAQSMFEQARAGVAATLGEQHPVTIGCMLNAAGGWSFTGHNDEARKLSASALNCARSSLGEDHPLTLSCQVAYAADLRAVGESGDADRTEADALRRISATLGPQHPHTRAAHRRERPYWDYEPYIG